MSNDLISRSALLNIFCNDCGIYEKCMYPCISYSIIEQAPTVDAEPVRHGRWRPYKQNVECSECYVKWAVDKSIAVVYTSIKDLKYCPNCGAKMDGDNNGSEKAD